MIRNHSRALSAAVLSVGAASLAGAQGWPILCDNPTTTASIWSNTYANNAVGTDLFGAESAYGGTVLYELCFGNPGFTANAAGLVGFFTGVLGSVQSNQDDLVSLTNGGGVIAFTNPATGAIEYGGLGARANWGYMATVRRDALTGDEAGTFTKFGTTTIDTFFYGASDRYLIAAATQDSMRVELRIDAIGDAARLRWRLTNQATTASNLGLWFGQYVQPIRNQTLEQLPMEFINIPGYKPLTIQRRFKRTPRPENHVYPMPPYIDFMPTQARAYEGYRVINTPTGDTGAFPDQTPVDGFDIGLMGGGWILGGVGANDDVFPFARSSDEEFDRFRDIEILIRDENPFTDRVAFAQKWFPRPVGAVDRPLSERQVEVVAYYKTTWGDSNFAKPYSVVGDPPKVIATQNDDPFSFQQSQYTVRVYIDNTRGFSEVDKEIALSNVQVRLSLPQGLADANDVSRRVMTRTISRVDPKNMRFVDFQIQALPTTFGVLSYSVEITPQTTSPKKVISGNIVVGSQPYLLIRDAANLVSAPWNFQNGSWASILGSGPEPLQPDIDFQAFTWDAATQQYVLQTGPQRNVGTWIISNKDVGFKALAGGPQQPQDFRTGAPLSLLKPGWNLIGNPYSYPIQVGQLVGVAGSDPTQALTYQEMVDQNIISSSLSYWDEGTQTYKFIGDAQDLIQPNTGYWMNVLIQQDVTISFPPVFIPFIPAGTGGIRSVPDILWTMNLVAKNGAGAVDNSNTVGYAKNSKAALKARVYEPPISPQKGAISSGFAAWNGTKPARLAKEIRVEASTSTFKWNVYSKAAGNVTLTWPQVGQVPTKYNVFLYDAVTGKKINMRTAPSYSYWTAAQTNRELKVIAVAQNVSLLSEVSAFRTGSNINSPVEVGYTLSSPAKATVTITQNGSLIRTLQTNVSVSSGRNLILWNLIDSRGIRARAGSYQANVSVTDEDGKTESKTVTFLIR
jgi:hypothetical protein